jgi:hypothetical protein
MLNTIHIHKDPMEGPVQVMDSMVDLALMHLLVVLMVLDQTFLQMGRLELNTRLAMGHMLVLKVDPLGVQWVLEQFHLFLLEHHLHMEHLALKRVQAPFLLAAVAPQVVEQQVLVLMLLRELKKPLKQQ